MTIRLFAALIEKQREGYSLRDLRADFLSGIVVSLVAIPLGMALAIASGVAPQYGLYTVVIGGGLVALLGGARFQVTGPTAAFVVILVPVVQKFGFGGLILAGFMAGIILLGMGLGRMGTLIRYIPDSVTTGFTAGIAVVIGTLQLKDFAGLHVRNMPETFLGKVLALVHAAPGFSATELAVGFATLAILVLWPMVNHKIPAPLVALSVVTVAVLILKDKFPSFDVATIGNRFTYNVGGNTGWGIPPYPPHFSLPWSLPGADGRAVGLSLKMFEALLPSAFSIAMLAAIESLLCAVVADGLGGTQHDPDAELIALGIGNIACPFFGGIAATGAIARTATNIRYGAVSPISAIVHAAVTLFVLMTAARYVSYLPMAGLAALLVLVACNMSQTKEFIGILKQAPRSDVLVLLTCFVLTVVFDMVVGVSVGVVLALSLKRLSKAARRAGLR
jgi:SulP family sulfate permease